MPLSTAYKKFKDDSHRAFPRYRSKRMDHVLACYKAYEKSDSTTDRARLKRGWETWMVSDPKEYANRNKTNNGLCGIIQKELEVRDLNKALKPQIFAHELTRRDGGRGPARATANTKCLNRSVEDYLALMADQGGSVAVILIDMQTKSGTSADLASMGAAEIYNSDSVFDNQISVLAAAAAYDMYVFEIRIVKTLLAKDSDDGPVTTVFHNDPTFKALSDEFPTKAGKLVKIDKPFYNSFQGTGLDEELRDKQIDVCVVMGFDAGICVKNTIFGTPQSLEYTKDGRKDVPYLPGLLDRGYSVVTARTVLASSGGARLDGEYNINA